MRLGTTSMGQETRRSFILAGSAQALIGLQASGAFGQTKQATPDLTPHQIETLDRIIEGFQFRRAVDLFTVFRRLLDTRIDVSLAIIEEEAKTVVLDLAMKAQNALQKDFGTDAPIPQALLRNLLADTILVQNIIFAASTDAKSGIVRITMEKLDSMRQYYCSFYPYCK
jgi:hypothetical protein